MSELMSAVCSAVFTGAVSGATVYLKGRLKKCAAKSFERKEHSNE